MATYELHNFMFGICTGERNWGVHLLFLVSATLYFLSIFGILLLNVIHVDTYEFTQLYINFFLLTLSLGAIIGTQVYFMWNLFLMLTNSTISEYFQWEKIPYLKNKKYRCLCLSPFYLGLTHSLKIFCCPLPNFKFRIYTL